MDSGLQRLDVTEGEARGVAIATGMHTELGRIATPSERVTNEESRLDLQVDVGGEVAVPFANSAPMCDRPWRMIWAPMSTAVSAASSSAASLVSRAALPRCERWAVIVVAAETPGSRLEIVTP